MRVRRSLSILLLSLAVCLPLSSQSYSITEEELLKIEKTLDQQQELIQDYQAQIEDYQRELKETSKTIEKQSKSLVISGVEVKILAATTIIASGVAVWQAIK